MQTIKLHAHVGADGLLKIELPLDVTNSDLEVLVVVQAISGDNGKSEGDLGWPPGFFERTYGSLRDEPLVRESEGNFEVREEIGKRTG